ncbi:hypothetical protein BT63DRAFT_420565 [Microthyrium microscopicum]|uniref:Uncharacterized protein n=1 Tax=Microthyrium microscopicum TaxID=703497 RepID=A0A6A6UU70_9PEZI|nr:hypothetical protein BT63DRAFT_420565 [Microthyrium microscopicum]
MDTVGSSQLHLFPINNIFASAGSNIATKRKDDEYFAMPMDALSNKVTMPVQPPHGIKRAATDDLERHQRMLKRFDRLHLDKHDGKVHTPVTASPDLAESRTHISNRAPRALSRKRRDDGDYDSMDVEDTKHRVFIRDLDQELAEAESDEEHPIFIPDIEKHLMKIPKSVLIGDDDRKRMEKMQLVIYNVPSSLTIPEEQDSVRRAILETRQRIRQGQPFRVPDLPIHHEPEPASAIHLDTHQETYSNDDYDPDAMDIE